MVECHVERREGRENGVPCRSTRALTSTVIAKYCMRKSQSGAGGHTHGGFQHKLWFPATGIPTLHIEETMEYLGAAERT